MSQPGTPNDFPQGLDYAFVAENNQSVGSVSS
jgi:hypothetical protein